MTKLSEPIAAKAQGAAQKAPLAVDLDGTLIRGDLFIEAILRFVASNPFNLFALIGWLLKGRAYAKAKLAEASPTDAATLPYDERVLEYLKAERESGRIIVLATASDKKAAQAVADHLGLFDAVFASDGEVNLKSARKAERLQEAFPDGFVYAGNDTPDLKVWAAAKQAVVVNAPKGLAAQARRRFTIEHSIAPQGGAPRALIKAIRPQQWAKNVLVFLPMLTGQGWLDMDAWINAFIAFFAVSMAASSVYLVNDAADIDADRAHHRKKKRPFASGALSPVTGLAAAVLLVAGGLSLGAVAGVLPFVALYLVVSSLYTFWLKRVTLVDVFVLGGLYTIRVVLGGAATGYFASSWLLAFCCFFFLSLALVKRFTEVETVAAKGGGELSRRGYMGSDGQMLAMLGVGAAFVSCLVLALYLQSDAVRAHYNEPFLLWALPAAVVFWLCRVWLLASRGLVHDDPLVFALRDKPSWLIGAVTAAAFAVAVLAPRDFITWG